MFAGDRHVHFEFREKTDTLSVDTRSGGVIVGTYGMIVLAHAFIGVVFAMGVWTDLDLTTLWRSKRWPTTKGKIISAEIRQENEERNDERGYYTAHVKYKYTVDGVEYVSNRICSRTPLPFDMYGESYENASLYRAGKTVLVYYNPEDPEQSVLKPGIRPKHIIAVLMGFVGVVLVGSLLAIRLTRQLY